MRLPTPLMCAVAILGYVLVASVAVAADSGLKELNDRVRAVFYATEDAAAARSDCDSNLQEPPNFPEFAKRPCRRFVELLSEMDAGLADVSARRGSVSTSPAEEGGAGSPAAVVARYEYVTKIAKRVDSKSMPDWAIAPTPKQIYVIDAEGYSKAERLRLEEARKLPSMNRSQIETEVAEGRHEREMVMTVVRAAMQAGRDPKNGITQVDTMPDGRRHATVVPRDIIPDVLNYLEVNGGATPPSPRAAQ